MGAPISDDQRALVLAEAGTGASRNEVARRTGVSTASVSRICSAAGHTFDRQRTIKATVARVVDLKAARVTLAGDLLGDVQEARARMHAATDERAFFDMARSVGQLVGAHARIVGIDGPPDDADQARSMLGAIAEGLGRLYPDIDGLPYDEHEGGEAP